ncbi:MAG: hypothetical protein LLG01_00640 [Planctomycetaceae bacterium]|nr:hypothetical protein [Planctomycetaceae bacterium]
MIPEKEKTLSHLLRQVARLLGIDNGSVRADFRNGQPRKVQPTPVIRLGEQK